MTSQSPATIEFFGIHFLLKKKHKIHKISSQSIRYVLSVCLSRKHAKTSASQPPHVCTPIVHTLSDHTDTHALSEIGHMAPNWGANDPYPTMEADDDEQGEKAADARKHAKKEAKEKPANVLRTERAVQRHAAWVCLCISTCLGI